MKKASRIVALFGATALALSACGAPPAENGNSASTSGADFKACMVSDQGGFDDKSFNESGHNGLKAIESEIGAEIQTSTSKTSADFIPNMQNLVQANCDMIYTVGYLFQQAVRTEAEANPNVSYAIIDSVPADDAGNPVEVANVKPLLFNTAEASYLAGYLAAGMSKTGTVATYGGMKFPSVTIFMDGFADGIAKYNEVHGKNVTLLGWNKETQDGSFSGDFEDQTKGKALTDGFISQGADIIMPVAGPVGAGTVASAQENSNVYVIWVDSDGALTNPQAADVILTSVMKEIAAAVETTANEYANNQFNNSPYVGTLENGGVGLAPYHEFEAVVPAELKTEVEDLKNQIISGEIVVESPSTPQN